MTRPTKEELEFELDCAEQPEHTATNREWFFCARRLAAEVRALQREVRMWSELANGHEATLARVESLLSPGYWTIPAADLKAALEGDR